MLCGVKGVSIIIFALPHSCCSCHVDLSMFPFVSVRLLLKKSVVSDRDCVLINNLSRSR